MNPQSLTIIFGIASALAWGAGDFAGGLATKKGNVYSVVLISQIIGGIFLLLLALLWRESVPPAADFVLGALAGVAGMIGLLGLYSGLAHGRMGIVAPLTAVISAAIPILFSLFTAGLPPTTQTLGFGLALAAVWLLSGAAGEISIHRTELLYSLIAGSGFALFFILIDQANETAVFWPLSAARLASVTSLALYIAVRRVWQRPARAQMPLIVLTGILDALGNAFFTFSARFGRLDLAAILSSLYPAATVLLAQIFLHERLNRPQWLGVLLALMALILITL
ncbi:MAG: DMT family transporter [Candidatus Promineifilaceae bacterium]|nr:DMT family transporter [Candidatus Promineifilaceae bacterium]